MKVKSKEKTNKKIVFSFPKQQGQNMEWAGPKTIEWREGPEQLGGELLCAALCGK